MAMADATRQSDALPSISYIDLDKIKRENSFYNSRVPSTAATSMPAPPLASPSSMYSGPPPPYSYPSSTASSVIGGHTNGNGYISPPTEPRRTLDEEQEQQQAVRQSLPSIREALNRDQPLSIKSLLSKTNVPPLSSLQTNQTYHGSNPSPASPNNLSYQDTSATGQPPTPARTRSSPIQSEAMSRAHYSPRSNLDTNSSRLVSTASRETIYPPMFPPRTIPSPVGANRAPMPPSTYRQPSPPYDSAPRPVPMGNPSPTYTSYPTSYTYPPAMPTVVAGYQPPSPSNPPTWRYVGPESDRLEDYRQRQSTKESLVKPAFGETVKRHLDSFDLETSLNEIAECSGRTLEFSNHYGSRAHQTQRSGPMPGSLPTEEECDEMMGYQKRVLDSMQRIKEVIIAQQHALAEQRNYEKYKPPSEADDDGANFHDKGEGSGGFAGADAKKRRAVRYNHINILKSQRLTVLQRTAPPGRCHSCNRAETPEWRRGPDGARTLCNACGLREWPAWSGHPTRRCTDLISRLCEIDTQDGLEAFDGRIESAA
ncbi:MAG: hypothetical protein Q9219_003743 [cf. Caloplaca sp. 3 TL-2023]